MHRRNTVGYTYAQSVQNADTTEAERYKAGKKARGVMGMLCCRYGVLRLTDGIRTKMLPVPERNKVRMNFNKVIPYTNSTRELSKNRIVIIFRTN